MTTPTQLVLRALPTDPAKELYGVEIGAAAGLPSRTVHPILARLEGGWLSSRSEVRPRTDEYDVATEGARYPLTPPRQ
jgi:PadR family transcriptional regulator, regulatory protein PadR